MIDPIEPKPPFPEAVQRSRDFVQMIAWIVGPSSAAAQAIAVAGPRDIIWEGRGSFFVQHAPTTPKNEA